MDTAFVKDALNRAQAAQREVNEMGFGPDTETMHDHLLSYIDSLERHVTRMKEWQEKNTNEEFLLRDDTAIATIENIIRELRIIADGRDWRK